MAHEAVITLPGGPSPRASERERAAFVGGAVVQVVAAGDPFPEVAELLAATVRITDRRLVANAGGTDWSWLLSEVSSVLHGPGSAWWLVSVPGVEDHGVQVRPDDVSRFRRELTAALHDAGRGNVDEAAPEPPSPSPDNEDLLDLTVPRAPAPRPADGGSAAFGPAPPAADPVPPAERQRGPEPADGDPMPIRRSPSLGARVAAVIERVSVRNGHSPDPGRAHVAVADPFPGRQPLAGLEAREISAWFGTHHVLDRVSLDVRPGQVTALIGPSGCGKSTFLRVLNRMHEMIPSASLAGQVVLDGADIYDPQRRLTDARRQIGMVFQKPNPFPAMSIYDNVVASFRLTGMKVAQGERDEVVETSLRKAGLWNEVKDRLRQPGGGLSGGQQQRLCIARALAIRPRVLLMDEPCSALDPTSTRRIEQTIEELADEVTIVIVTHNMQQAARVSHHCAFFLAEQGTPGVVVEHGPTAAMFETPQDPRTLDYVNGRFG